MLIEFEFDADKGEVNRKKHGIDFVEAQRLWEGLTVQLPSRNRSEPRWLVIGIIDGLHWTAIVTDRVANIRIISVRRARDEEREIYKQNNL